MKLLKLIHLGDWVLRIEIETPIFPQLFLVFGCVFNTEYLLVTSFSAYCFQ